MAKSIYIAGPMSGLPNNGYDAFNAKAVQLRTAGWHVINPAEMDIEAGLDPDREFTRFDYMQAAKRDETAMLHDLCEAAQGCRVDWIEKILTNEHRRKCC